MTETQLLHLMIQRAPAELPDARIFRRNVGLFRTIGPATDDLVPSGRLVKVGIEGQADAYALLRGGINVEIETKSAKGAMREAQLRWRAFCETWCIPHVVLKARRGAEPDAIVAEWIEELRAVFCALTRTA